MTPALETCACRHGEGSHYLGFGACFQCNCEKYDDQDEYDEYDETEPECYHINKTTDSEFQNWCDECGERA